MQPAAAATRGPRRNKTPQRQTTSIILHFVRKHQGLHYHCRLSASAAQLTPWSFVSSRTTVFEHENPALKSVPLAVQQKQILVTCNYEARSRLIHEAQKACPDLVIVLGEDLTRFRDASKLLYAFLRSFSWNKRCQRLGFDEVFLDVTDMIEHNVSILNVNDLSNSFFCLAKHDPTVGFPYDATRLTGHLYPESVNDDGLGTTLSDPLLLRLALASHLAHHLRTRLESHMGYTATVGVSTNKLLSKLVGNTHKPNAQTTLVPPYVSDGDSQTLDNVTRFLDAHEVGKVPGIGFKTAQKLRAHVLQRPASFDAGLVYGATQEHVSVRDVRMHPAMGPDMLDRLLHGPGVPQGTGARIWSLLNGCDETKVEQARETPRQISIEDSYLRLTTLDAAVKELRVLAKRLIERMHTDLLDEDQDHVQDQDASSVPSETAKRWLAHPRTIRLSTRPRPPQNPDGGRNRTFARISRSAPMPSFVFSLKDDIASVTEKLLCETLVPLFRRLHPDKGGWNLSLLNVAATNMADAASDKGGVGRDISKMFKRQDEALRQRRVEEPPAAVMESMQNIITGDAFGSEDVPTPSQEVDTSAADACKMQYESTSITDRDSFNCSDLLRDTFIARRNSPNGQFIAFNIDILRNIVFLYFVLRWSRITFYQLKGRGIFGSTVDAYLSIRRYLYGVFLRLPGVRDKVHEQVSESIMGLERKLVPSGPGVQRLTSLPAEGWSEDEVRAKLDELANMDHARWEDGRVSGAVYHGGDDLIRLQTEAFGKFTVSNPIHPDVFPGVRKMEAEIVAMVLSLFNAPHDAVGVTTSGGTESILMACLSARNKAYKERGVTEPEMILPETGHTAFRKACEYFKIKVHLVECKAPSYRVHIPSVSRLINPNTIMMVGSAPNFPHGIIDDISALSKLAYKKKIPLHVDCCLGSLLVPMLAKAGFDNEIFDFRLKGVTSISCDTHKYGFAPKGSSTVLYRSDAYRKYQYFISPDWSGGVYASPSIAGSRPGALIAGCWASLVKQGANGYLESCLKIVGGRQKIEAAIRERPELSSDLKIIGRPMVSVVAFLSNTLDIYDIADAMGAKGWHLNALQNPPAIHVAVTLPIVAVADKLINDLIEVTEEVREAERKRIAEGKGAKGAVKGDTAALYGVAGSLPNKSVVEDLAKGFLDTLLRRPWRGVYSHRTGLLQPRRRLLQRLLPPRPLQILLRNAIHANLCQPHNRGIPLLHKLIQAGQLIARQSKRILDNLLMQIALYFKDDLANRDPGGPPIKASLSLSHTHIVARRVDANVCGDAHVEAELHAAEALLDGLFGDAELAVVAPDDCGAAHAAACGFFGGGPPKPSQGSQKDEPAPKKAAPKKKGRTSRVVEDSDDDEEEAKPKKASPKKPAAKKAKREPTPEPELEETTTSAFFGSSNKPKRTEPVKKKAAEAPKTTPKKPAAKPSGKAANGKTSGRAKKLVTSYAERDDDDEFPDDDLDGGDDIFGDDIKGKSKDDYQEASESDEDVPIQLPHRGTPKAPAKQQKAIKDEDEDEDEFEPDDEDVDMKDLDGDDDFDEEEETAKAKSKKVSAASKKRKSPEHDEDEDDEDKPAKPKAKKAAPAKSPAKKKAKKDDVEDSADIQAIYDSIPTVRAPTPPPKDPNGKFNWQANAARGDAGPAQGSSADMPQGSDTCLAGLNFVFTGVLQKWGRTEMTTAPSKKTNYVVLGEDAGPSKLQKIRDMNIKTIDEDAAGNKGDSKAQAVYAEKQRKEQEKIEKQAAELELEEKKRQKELKAAAAAAGNKASSAVTAAVQSAGPEVDSRLWTTKYAPTSLAHICGNKASVERLQRWLQAFPKSLKTGFKLAGKDGSGVFRAVMIHGPPGIGYDIVERNANGLRGVLRDGKKVEGSKKKLVLIMDEVDGMSAGDRGGTEVPMILICNDRRQPKMKPFDYVRSRIMTIAFREGLKIHSDIRQVVNMISTAKIDQEVMDYDKGKAMSKNWEKHVVLKPWDITQKILGGGMFAASSKATLNEKIELYFNDHEFSPLMLQENYLGTNPILSGGYSGKEKNLKNLELVSQAADSISDGDLVDRMIHGSQQQWSLMPTHAVFSFVRPASFVAGNTAGNQTRFTSRMVKEIQAHMRLRSSGDRHEIRQQYKLQKEGKEAVPEIIELMDSYYLTKDDFDAIMELGIDSQAKSTFTRLYNQQSHPLPFMKASTVTAPKKQAKEKPDLEEAIEESDEGEVIEEIKDEDDEDVDLSKDKYVKQPKKKAAPKKPAAAKKGAKKAKDEDSEDEEDEDAKPKGKGKGKAKAPAKGKK
ncbi:replication factor c subunit 1 [Bipolaris maydis]|nr:replication factor c subunit 1 [Bipolaris maydis]